MQLLEPHSVHLHKEVVGPRCHEDFYGRGYPQDGVMLIGIAPGREEVRKKVPFVGPSGTVLDEMLRGVGWGRDKVYCTNMICWWKDDPNREEAERCYPRLRQEILTLQPKLIITLGGLVTEFFTGRKLFETRGNVMWNKEFQTFVMPTNHPAAVLHADDDDQGPNIAMDLWRDFSKIPDILEMPRNDESERAIYTVVTDPREARYVIDHLPRRNEDGTGTPVALDVETNSKDLDEIDVIDDRLLCWSVSTPQRGETWVFTPDAWDGLDEILKKLWTAVRWTMHNGPFDSEVIYGKFGVWLKIWEDTMMQSYTLDERPGRHRLKPLGREYNAGGFWEEPRKKAANNMLELAQTNPELLYAYNAGDSWNTAQLQPKFQKRQIADDVRGFYESILIPAINVFNKVQFRGVPVDKKTLGVFAIMWGQDLLETKERLEQMATDYGHLGSINLDSHPQLNRFCYDILALPRPPHANKTKSGRTTDKKALDFWEGQHPFPTELKGYREQTKAYDTYIAGGDRHLKHTGRAHPKIGFHGSLTGRPVYKDPPLQTIPRPFSENEKYKKLRTLYTAGGPGRCVIEADFSKAEVWMAYYYSRDKQIYDDLCSGDYHRMVASSVYKLTPEQVTDWMRSETKKIVFGTFYGMEEQSMAERTKSTADDAREFIKAFHDRNHDYTLWAKEIQRLVSDEGEIVTLTGRKRRFILTGSRSDYRAFKQAVNFPIQSTSSDVTITSAVEMYDELVRLDAYIMITVHDSIVVDCPVENLEAVLHLMHRVMTATKFPPHNIYVPIEIKIGSNWGAAKGVHDCEKQGCLTAVRDGVDHMPDFSNVVEFVREQKLVAA